jgi:hypothetical protein
MSSSIRIALALVLFSVLVVVITPGRVTADITHGGTCATATPIALNSSVRAALNDPTDIAVYRLILGQRGVMDVWTDPGSFTVWDFDLLNATCEPVASVFAGTSIITGHYAKITVPSVNIPPMESVWTLGPGTYFIRLHPAPVLVQGEPFMFHTKFTAHYGHDCATAEPMPKSGTIEGTLLYPEDREVFRVPVNPPAKIHAWTTGPFATPDQPKLDLYFSDCSGAYDMEANDESKPGMVSTMLEVGTYYIAVEPFKPDLLGHYTLRVELER